MPYSGKLDNYVAIVDGVAEIKLEKNVSGDETGSVEKAMIVAAIDKHGDHESHVDFLLLLARKVMLDQH